MVLISDKKVKNLSCVVSFILVVFILYLALMRQDTDESCLGS